LALGLSTGSSSPVGIVRDQEIAARCEAGTGSPNGGSNRGEADSPGNWRTSCSPALIADFKERYGELLVRLGYENTLDW
jgi:hypothetical protein